MKTSAQVGRNDPCPCGSGKKYKKCCLDKDEAALRRSREMARAAAHHHECDDPSHHHGPASAPKPEVDLSTVSDEELVDELLDDPDFDGEFDDDDEDPIWAALDGVELDEQVALIRSRLADSDPISDLLALDLLQAVSTALLRAGQGAELISLIETLRSRHPATAQEVEIFLLSLEAWMALANRAESGRALLAVAERARHDPEETIRLLDAYRYHGRTDDVANALIAALASLAPLGEDRPEVDDDVHEIAAQIAIAQALDASPDLAPDDPALASRLAAFGRVDPTFLSELVARRTGRGAKPLTLTDYLSVSTSDAAEERIFLLSLEFCGELPRAHGWPRARAEMARSELSAYLVERVLERADRGPQGLKEALRGVPERAGYLLPDPVSAAHYLAGAVDPLVGAAHRAGALLAALPRWFDFLVARGLADGGEAAELWARTREQCRDVEVEVDDLSEDSQLVTDLFTVLHGS